MRDRMERLVVLPFSIGCVSESSVAVMCDHPKKSKSEPNPSLMRGLEEERFSGVKMKNSFGFLSFAKPNISTGLQKLIKSIKNFSHIFVYKEEIKEMGMEMEIGFPTDVKHVTHIGWDGSAATNHIKDWDDLKAPELFSLPPISLRQFELAMAAQDETPLLVSSSKS